MPNILFYAETRGDALRKAALETATVARDLADTQGGESHAILAGVSEMNAAAAALGEHGADVVLLSRHEAFREFNAEAIAAFVAEQAARGEYGAVLLAASVHGRELGARVAARLGAGLASDVISIEVKDGAFEAKHPINTAKVLATVRVSGSPAVLSLRPNMFSVSRNPRNARVENIDPAGDPAAARVKVTERTASAGAKLDLSEAPIVVSGGRGLKAPENFKLAEDLALAFGNAAVGCTRAVSDAGWRPHSDQIGQTGRAVSPDLYVAVGISGAIQHIAGMRNSRTIVAINKDPEAPIFKVADYGIVGDVFEVVPALTEGVRRAREGAS